MSRVRVLQLITVTMALALAAACGSHTTPAVPPSTASPGITPPPVPQPPRSGATETPATRTEPVTPPPTVAPPVSIDPLEQMALDDLNRAAALKPVFFLYDSDQLDESARQVLTEDSQLLKQHANWIITVEGHCDERGSAEYNLALGDRRAQVARNYLVSLGIQADRLRTVSYGKEFPFDPGHDESAWLKNRRAQFMVTAK